MAMLQACEPLCQIEKALQVSFCQVYPQYFNGDLGPQKDMFGEVDLRKSCTSKQANQAVVASLSSLLIRHLYTPSDWAAYHWWITWAASRQRRSKGGNSQAQANTPSMYRSSITFERAALYAAACSTWSSGVSVETSQ